MTAQLLQSIIDRKAFPDSAAKPELIETHISWVVLTDHYAFKIKKPVQYTFLDFSTLAKRACYCESEVRLNRRLAPHVYLGVLPIVQTREGPVLRATGGEIVDYAVWMQKLDTQKEMDRLLVHGEVGANSIRAIARQLALFHLKNRLPDPSVTPVTIQADFEGIKDVFAFAEKQWGTTFLEQLQSAVTFSAHFLQEHHDYLLERSRLGCIVDGHGDLHSGNIFILDEPVIFDCIEFDDQLRTLDVLNEVAFLCMDLERFDRADLARIFMDAYVQYFPCMNDSRDQQLLLYYKWYRSNVRFKINCLHAMGSHSEKKRLHRLQKAEEYMQLFQKYMESLLSVNSL